MEDFVSWGQGKEPFWKRLLVEIAANNGRCKGRAEICQAASQEQGHSRPMSPSADRGEEVGGQSVPKTELPFQPQLLPYIHNGGRGDPGSTLVGVWVNPLTGRFKSPGSSWNIPCCLLSCLLERSRADLKWVTGEQGFGRAVSGLTVILISSFHGGMPLMHQLVATEKEVKIQSPTSSALSISSVHWHVSVLLGSTSARPNCSRDVDGGVEKSSHQHIGNESC